MTDSLTQLERPDAQRLNTERLGGMNLLKESLRPRDGALRNAEFANLLASATASGQDKDPTREAAEQLVAVTFIQPILRAARESNNAAPPFAPTAIEKQFGPLMDATLSDSMMRASRWPLVDRIEQDMRANGNQLPPALTERSKPPALERPAMPLASRSER